MLMLLLLLLTAAVTVAVADLAAEGCTAPASASAPALAQRAALRPEHLTLAPLGQGIPATVVLAEHLGDVSILYLRVEGVSELLNAKVATAHQAQCAAGQTVGLAPDASWALAFGADGRLLSR